MTLVSATRRMPTVDIAASRVEAIYYSVKLDNQADSIECFRLVDFSDPPLTLFMVIDDPTGERDYVLVDRKTKQAFFSTQERPEL